jgi:hypothetical protein
MDVDSFIYGEMHFADELKLLLTKAKSQLGPDRDYDIVIDAPSTQPAEHVAVTREQMLRNCEKPPLGAN